MFSIIQGETLVKCDCKTCEFNADGKCTRKVITVLNFKCANAKSA
jgi:hypothetical protein